jgi:glycosyltransferase involved in cell wall biosynthesis
LKQPTVTIGITAYNAEDTIREALQSALEQTLPAHQIIVVDDCSTDTTMDVLAEYESYPNVEIHQNPQNGGVAVSRNVIVEHATGEFIVFFDDDDISAKDRAEAQVRRIVDYETEFAAGAPVLCHTARRQIFPDGHERIEPTMGQRPGWPAPSGPPVARRALMGEPLDDAYGSCATCSQAARTTVYREAPGRAAHDGDFGKESGGTSGLQSAAAGKAPFGFR